MSAVLALATMGLQADASGTAATNSAWHGIWGTAVPVPGLASLNLGFGSMTTISCPSLGNCSGGGYYASELDPLHSFGQAFVDNESNGVWGKAIRVPGLAALVSIGPEGGGGAGLTSISCAAAGSCAAVGEYTDAQGHLQDFVVDESGGVWGSAEEIPGLGALNAGGRALVHSVSCGGVGDCAAVGGAWDANNDWQGFVAVESGGVWGSATKVPAPTGTGAVGTFLDDVSCHIAGACTAVGSYETAERPIYRGQGLVVEETGATWGSAQVLPGLAALNGGANADVQSISCAGIGRCAAAGFYRDAKGAYQGFVVDESGGTWGSAEAIPGLGRLNVGGNASVASISCVSSTCAAGGIYYADTKNHQRGFVVNATGGKWGEVQRIPGLGALGANESGVQSISCGAAGNCTAGGFAGAASLGFVADEVGGKWQRAQAVAGLGATGSATGVSSVSCAAANQCDATGEYATSNGSGGYVVAEPGKPPYCSAMLGLRAAVASHRVSAGSVVYRIVYTNHGDAGCELAGIPGAIGYAATTHAPVGPPAVRTTTMGHGGSVYLEGLGGRAANDFVIREGATGARTCHPTAIDEVVIRPIGVPEIMVPLDNAQREQRLVCRIHRNEAIYGFAPIPRPRPSTS